MGGGAKDTVGLGGKTLIRSGVGSRLFTLHLIPFLGSLPRSIYPGLVQTAQYRCPDIVNFPTPQFVHRTSTIASKSRQKLEAPISTPSYLTIRHKLIIWGVLKGPQLNLPGDLLSHFRTARSWKQYMNLSILG